MSDPLLSSLCRVCNAHRPKYRCPRCESQTCSLTCCKRHKVWSECNGIRDPTVYRAKRELATPAGIDHDYNFIAGIERRVERTNKLIVEEKGLVHRRELHGNEHKSINPQRRGPRLPVWALRQSRVTIDRAPGGMQRNRENGTRWNKAQGCITWQIEWIRDDGSRALSKAVEKQPIGDVYSTLLEEERRTVMTDAERKRSKRRRAAILKSQERTAKRTKLDISNSTLVHPAILQDPSSSWDITFPQKVQEDPILEYQESPSLLPYGDYPPSSGYYFYLHCPYTPSDQKVLVPLHPSARLSALLQNRVVLEFPTIYVLSSPPTSLPIPFMREDQYLDKQHGGAAYQHLEVASPDDSTSRDFSFEISDSKEDCVSEESEPDEGEVIQ